MKEKNDLVDEIKIVDTDNGSKNGQNKCPKCGASEITLDVKTSKLKCEFCRHVFEPQKVEGLEENLKNLEGVVIGSGAKNIATDSENIMTLKCSGCGAEVVVDLSSNTQARCHWCRNVLSVNQKVPNGAVPDIILPFKIEKNVAKDSITEFVKKRQFYAHPTFKKEFTTNNVMGVYFPYMSIDFNGHCELEGKGQILKRTYIRTEGEHRVTYYDADEYEIERKFDIIISNLTIESSKQRLDKKDSSKTNNIINSIMPFDVENSVKYDSNYLKGYTSEKRDINVEELKGLANSQASQVSKFAVNNTLTNYNRGVRWEKINFTFKGEQWKAAYLPVWLYSYCQKKNDKEIIHYVAVNARTKETMGSVPVYIPKLLFISSLVEIMGFICMLFVDFDYDYLFLSLGVIYYLFIYNRYRNKNARHTYETETKNEVSNLTKKDTFLVTRKGLESSKIDGVNNTTVEEKNGLNLNLDNVVDVTKIIDNIKIFKK